MPTGSTSTAASADGTQIAFTWAYPGAEAFEWRRDRSHWPDPGLPMDIGLREDAFWQGADRAWEEFGAQAPGMFYRFQFVGPFLYARETPDPPEKMGPVGAASNEVVRRHGNALGYWREYCQPRIEQACNQLSSAETDISLHDAARTWGYGFAHTFTSLIPIFVTGLQLMALIGDAAGADGGLLLQEATQGGANTSQAIDAEVWGLSQLARQEPTVVALFQNSALDELLDALRREPKARPFVAAFESLLHRHGRRSQGWDIALPTWRERPEAPLSLVRAQLAAPAVSPKHAAAGSAATRQRAIDAILAVLPEDKHSEFRRLVDQLEGYVDIRENRAYWQMVITGEVRGLLLRKGAQFVHGGRIDAADDVLFLQPEELEAGASGDLREAVRARRREWERWRRIEPPDQIGTPSAAAPPEASGQDELRGAPASRGQVTGPARILRDPEESDRLRHGDVLICVMTTPAWTPLFSIAAGIVTETGGALSHPAITAREYGIPAVVAAKDATSRIRDGQIISIDGATGVISLTPAPSAAAADTHAG